MEKEYHIRHRAPGRDNAPAHDLTANGVYPADIYSADSRFYINSPEDRDSYRIVAGLRGRPGALIEIFRAVPAGVDRISPGDWVAVSRSVAEWHAGFGAEELGEASHVIGMTVRADEIYTDGNSLSEWGYAPA